MARISIILLPELGTVIIRLDETSTYLILAHLKPGSIQVAEDENVIEGQVIGQCGNSGTTSEPHIHIHHQRQDPTIYPLGFAEGLPLYFGDQGGEAMPQGGLKLENGKTIAIGATVQYVEGK